MPIEYNGRIVGVLECINKLDDLKFTADDLSLVQEMANEAASVLHNKYMESALRVMFCLFLFVFHFVFFSCQMRSGLISQ